MKRVLLFALAVWALAACNQEDLLDPRVSKEANVQLAAAKAATERYKNIDNALADGFVDIKVVMAGTGHHFLNEAGLDAMFDASKPELLVYNLEADGKYRLVAVEYAVPLSLSANAPAGFAGDSDVWDRNTTFELWTLHAWVWMENADGVFKPFNPGLR